MCFIHHVCAVPCSEMHSKHLTIQQGFCGIEVELLSPNSDIYAAMQWSPCKNAPCSKVGTCCCLRVCSCVWIIIFPLRTCFGQLMQKNLGTPWHMPNVFKLLRVFAELVNIVSLLARNCWNVAAIHTTDEWSILILPVCHRGSRGAMYAKGCITVPSSETVCCFRCSPGFFSACCLRLLEFGAGLFCVSQAGNRAAVGARPPAMRAIQRPGVLPGFAATKTTKKNTFTPQKLRKRVRHPWLIRRIVGKCCGSWR